MYFTFNFTYTTVYSTPCSNVELLAFLMFLIYLARRLYVAPVYPANISRFCNHRSVALYCRTLSALLYHFCEMPFYTFEGHRRTSAPHKSLHYQAYPVSPLLTENLACGCSIGLHYVHRSAAFFVILYLLSVYFHAFNLSEKHPVCKPFL